MAPRTRGSARSWREAMDWKETLEIKSTEEDFDRMWGKREDGVEDGVENGSKISGL